MALNKATSNLPAHIAHLKLKLLSTTVVGLTVFSVPSTNSRATIPTISTIPTTSTTPTTATLIETPEQHLAQCKEQYANGQFPQLTSSKPIDLYYLCFDGFAVGYSGVTRTAIWSAEYLTQARIAAANALEREDNFHEESRLPGSVKATLADYKHTPYDRGHLAPNADMATQEQQYNSFSLANIMPQNPKNNRNSWRDIESQTRYLTLQYGQAYVVTGTAYLHSKSPSLHGRVMVPSHLYKAIYLPSIQQAGVYFMPNDDSQRVEVISIQQLNQRVGINVMPSLPSAVTRQAFALPLGQQRSMAPVTNNQSAGIFQVIGQLIHAFAQWITFVLSR